MNNSAKSKNKFFPVLSVEIIVFENRLKDISKSKFAKPQSKYKSCINYKNRKHESKRPTPGVTPAECKLSFKSHLD